jgi:hypothetical protein
LQEKQDKLLEMARGFEYTNRGVVALYAELDEKAGTCAAPTNESRFLSNMSHEFRTPLNSVRALCKLLLSNDGPRPTTRKIRSASSRRPRRPERTGQRPARPGQDRGGKLEVGRRDSKSRSSSARCAGCCAPARQRQGRPAVRGRVGLPPLFTDESKVFADPAQFHLERAEVHRARVLSWSGAELDGNGTSAVSPSPTPWIGIRARISTMIFEEFTQVQSQAAARGEGHRLGFRFAGKLAALLGGEVRRGEQAGRGLDILGAHSAARAGLP